MIKLIGELAQLGERLYITLKNIRYLDCIYMDAKVIFYSLEHSNSRAIKEAIQNEFQGSNFNLHPFQTQGSIQHFTMITEPQLYFMLMRSDKPKARDFRQWVINEVLPSIRKEGSYSVGASNEMFSLKDELIKAKNEVIKTKEELIETQRALINELKTKKDKNFIRAYKPRGRIDINFLKSEERYLNFLIQNAKFYLEQINQKQLREPEDFKKLLS